MQCSAVQCSAVQCAPESDCRRGDARVAAREELECHLWSTPPTTSFGILTRSAVGFLQQSRRRRRECQAERAHSRQTRTFG